MSDGSDLLGFYCCNNVLHQASKDKPRSLKCCHFCLSFDNHNYCPSCRESNRGDDPCVSNEKSCEICSGFSEEQIKNRRYVRKQKVADTSKDDEPDPKHLTLKTAFLLALASGKRCSKIHAWVAKYLI